MNFIKNKRLTLSVLSCKRGSVVVSIDGEESDQVEFCISDQTSRGEEFIQVPLFGGATLSSGEFEYDFLILGNWALRSMDCPEVRLRGDNIFEGEHKYLFFVRGSNVSSDDNVLSVRWEKFLSLARSVVWYNQLTYLNSTPVDRIISGLSHFSDSQRERIMKLRAPL